MPGNNSKKTHFPFKSTKIIGKCSFRSDTSHFMEHISTLIKNKKYKQALAIYNDIAKKTEEIQKMGFFLEIHIINTLFQERERKLIDFFRNPRSKDKRIIENSTTQDPNIKEHTKINSFSCDPTKSLKERTQFIIDNSEKVSKEFHKFPKLEQFRYVQQVFMLTEDKFHDFLGNNFDVEVMRFMRAYHRDGILLFRTSNYPNYSFLTDKSYYELLTCYELIEIYDFTKNFDIFLLALSKNPFINRDCIIDAFKKHMPYHFSTFAKQVVQKTLEAQYIFYLYERAKHEKILTQFAGRRKRIYHIGFQCPLQHIYNDKKKHEKM